MAEKTAEAMRKRSVVAYSVIAALLGAILAWQAVGHARYRADTAESAREIARRVASNMSLIIESQGRSGLLHRQRLEDAFNTYTENRRTTKSVAVLNEAGALLAAGGEPLPVEANALIDTPYYQTEDTIVVTLPLERLEREGQPPSTDPLIVLDAASDATELLPGRTLAEDLLYGARRSTKSAFEELFAKAALEDADLDQLVALLESELTRSSRMEKVRMLLAGAPLTRERLDLALRVLVQNALPEQDASGAWLPQLTPRAVLEGCDEAAYAQLAKDRGVRWFVYVTDAEHFEERIAGDRNFRLSIAALAVLAAGGLALAWRYLERAGNLQLGLVRARERNAHLQDMNLAAAGLAHETKNPLNVIRGHAQLVGRRGDLPTDVVERARAIIEESDRITSRLNQFIEYSKPIEPKPRRCRLLEVARDVARTLEMVLDDKRIRVELTGPDKEIVGDPALLRQVYFNLMLNAAHAVQPGGRIDVRTEEDAEGSVSVSVADDGPGIPAEERETVFRPYYTRSASGTGLGLAVVRQIAHAQDWEVSCEGNGGGACFRIRGFQRTGTR